MSAPNDSDGRAGVPGERESVLGNLPRTRPQRSSARRAAARRSTAPERTADSDSKPARSAARAPRAAGRTASAASRPSRPKAAKVAAGKPRKARAQSRGAASAAKQAVPRQGFESEADRARGAVQPPGGTELLASAVEIVGDLAKSGLATGERVLKDVFSRLSP
jgi:hypothetical protein